MGTLGPFIEPGSNLELSLQFLAAAAEAQQDRTVRLLPGRAPLTQLLLSLQTHALYARYVLYALYAMYPQYVLLRAVRAARGRG